MSNSGYNPKVLFPNAYKEQTKSLAFQKPFFFGGSQTPLSLGLSKQHFSGSGFVPSSNTKTYVPKSIKYHKK